MGVSWLSGAHGALLRPIGREAGFASDRSRRGQRVRDALAGAEVHLVGRLAVERRVGERPAPARPHRVAPLCRRKDVKTEQFSPGRAPLATQHLRGRLPLRLRADRRIHLRLAPPRATRLEGHRDRRRRRGGVSISPESRATRPRHATLPSRVARRRARGRRQISRVVRASSLDPSGARRRIPSSERGGRHSPAARAQSARVENTPQLPSSNGVMDLSRNAWNLCGTPRSAWASLPPVCGAGRVPADAAGFEGEFPEKARGGSRWKHGREVHRVGSSDAVACGRPPVSRGPRADSVALPRAGRGRDLLEPVLGQHVWVSGVSHWRGRSPGDVAGGGRPPYRRVLRRP